MTPTQLITAPSAVIALYSWKYIIPDNMENNVQLICMVGTITSPGNNLSACVFVGVCYVIHKTHTLFNGTQRPYEKTHSYTQTMQKHIHTLTNIPPPHLVESCHPKGSSRHEQHQYHVCKPVQQPPIPIDKGTNDEGQGLAKQHTLCTCVGVGVGVGGWVWVRVNICGTKKKKHNITYNLNINKITHSANNDNTTHSTKKKKKKKKKSDTHTKHARVRRI